MGQVGATPRGLSIAEWTELHRPLAQQLLTLTPGQIPMSISLHSGNKRNLNLNLNPLVWPQFEI